MTSNAATEDRSAGLSDEPTAPAAPRPGAWRSISRVLLGLGLIAGVVVAILHRNELQASAIEGHLASLGGWAPLAFVALYVVGTVFLAPGSIFTLAGGALFGPVLGAVYSLVGATIGGTISFLIARYLAADLVARRTGERLRTVLDGVARDEWRFVAFVRLVPLLPFNALNYALGLTSIRLVPYVVASAVCMIPGAAVYAFLGHAGREVASGSEGSIKAGLVALSLLGALSLLPSLVKRLRRTPEHDETPQ